MDLTTLKKKLLQVRRYGVVDYPFRSIPSASNKATGNYRGYRWIELLKEVGVTQKKELYTRVWYITNPFANPPITEDNVDDLHMNLSDYSALELEEFKMYPYAKNVDGGKSLILSPDFAMNIYLQRLIIEEGGPYDRL